MKKTPLYFQPVQLTLLLFLFVHKVSAQNVQSLDISPELSAHAEKWGIGYNGKESDVRLAHFGPFAVTDIEKLDSGAFKNKVKEEKGGSYDSKDGYDEYKIRRIDKNSLFRMFLTGETDSTETVFSAFTSTRKKTETILGTILSKNTTTGGSETMSERKQAEGMIIIKNDPVHWSFFIDYPNSSSSTRMISSELSGYLTNGSDTLTLRVLYSFVRKLSKDTLVPGKTKMTMARGVSLMNPQGEQIAALVFKPPMAFIAKKSDNYTNDEMVMINKEMNKPVRMAVASLYALMIGLQGYQ